MKRGLAGYNLRRRGKKWMGERKFGKEVGFLLDGYGGGGGGEWRKISDKRV